VELGWNDQAKRADIHSCIDHSIVIATVLGWSILHRVVLGALSLLLLWEAVETIDNSQVVEIHDGPQGNKVDGLFELNDLNKTTIQTAGWGLKTKETTNKTRGEAKQVKQGVLGC